MVQAAASKSEEAAKSKILGFIPTGQYPSSVFAADGKSLATRGEDGFARVWDAANGAVVRRFCPPDAQVAALARTRAGALVALAAVLGSLTTAQAAELDPKAVQIKTPGQFKFQMAQSEHAAAE